MKKAMTCLTQFAVAPTIAIALMLSMGASNPNARYERLGHEMMCVCGCNEILMECNHDSCPDSPVELAELKADLAKGMTDHQVFAAFQAEYGPTVLAAPMLTRFNMVAWIVPPLLLVLGLFGVMGLVRKWRLRAATVPAAANVQDFDQLRSRIRKETDL
ncbi:MAG: cytochrome c-type biogenesis protein CcmH [Acidobacteriaceae bacterium]